MKEKRYERFDLTPDNKHNFSISYFHGKPLLYMETIAHHNNINKRRQLPKKGGGY